MEFDLIEEMMPRDQESESKKIKQGSTAPDSCHIVQELKTKGFLS